MGIAAIILAAGSGSRMKMNITKQRIKLKGISLLLRSAKVFDACDVVDSITVVVRDDEVDFARAELSEIKKLNKIVSGGDTRLKSAKKGLMAVSGCSEFVAIHDAARCLVTSEIIKSVYEDAKIYGGATASCALTDTVKKVDGDGNIIETVDRSLLFAMQTPQIFDFNKYSKAISLIDENDSSITDDNMIFERAGYFVHCTETGKGNIKITVAEDLKYAEFLLGEK